MYEIRKWFQTDFFPFKFTSAIICLASSRLHLNPNALIARLSSAELIYLQGKCKQIWFYSLWLNFQQNCATLMHSVCYTSFDWPMNCKTNKIYTDTLVSKNFLWHCDVMMSTFSRHKYWCFQVHNLDTCP